MLKFAANLSFLFVDAPFNERFERAAKAGFQGVEYLFPYEWPAQVLGEMLESFGLQQVLFNLPPGNWDAGERGLGCLPDRQDEFRQGVELALNYAVSLKCRRVHCMAGLRPEGGSEAVLERTYIENLRYAADRMATQGIELTIEPINSRIDMPGYWLDSIEKALLLIKRVDRKNVKLQLDLYHAQIIQGDLARTIEANLPLIAHIQIADNPGRHEPGTGEINYPYLFSLLSQVGYSGWIGCEYKPKALTEQGLGWMQMAY